MVKCAKKLINQLTKRVNVTKSHWIKATEIGGVSCMSAYYLKFYFSHAYTRLFFPTNYKRLQNVFNVVTKQRQNWNTERIMQFFKIAAYVHIAKLYGLVHYAACAFCPIYKWLVVCACLRGLSGCFMRYWLVWAFRDRKRECVWRYCVFVSVDVKYIIHYRRICKFICSL